MKVNGMQNKGVNYFKKMDQSSKGKAFLKNAVKHFTHLSFARRGKLVRNTSRVKKTA